MGRNRTAGFARQTPQSRSLLICHSPFETWQDVKQAAQSMPNKNIVSALERHGSFHVHRAAEYRGIAAKLRGEAMATSLPRQRQLNLSAALRWEVLAEEIEAMTAPAFPRLSQRSNWVY
jgi:hypothetical protein